MVFRNTTKALTPEYTLALLRSQAPIRLLNYHISKTEQPLDNYLKETFGMSLRDACWQLIRHSNWTIADGRVRVSFVAKYYKKLATLITYGNGIVSGSNILFTIFT